MGDNLNNGKTVREALEDWVKGGWISYPNGQFAFRTWLQFGLGFEYSGKPHSR